MKNKKTILVVEDDKEYQDMLKRVLTKEGFGILTANDGKAALDRIEKEEVHLIILDILMPNVDGISFYYRLRNIAKKETPVLVLTNLPDVQAYEAGIKDVLVKANVSIQEVVSKVKKLIA